MTALLPPSSSRPCPARRPTTSATRRPMRAASRSPETSGSARIVDQQLADVGARADDQAEHASAASVPRVTRVTDLLHGDRGQRRLLRTASRRPCRRRPAASAAFQAQTATGKLNAEMMPTGAERVPLLEHAVRRPLASASSGRTAAATGRRRSRRCRSSPGLRRAASARILPFSRLIEPRQVRLCARASAWPSWRTISPRRGAGTCRQPSKARSALATAVSYSARVGVCTVARTDPDVGSRVSIGRPPPALNRPPPASPLTVAPSEKSKPARISSISAARGLARPGLCVATIGQCLIQGVREIVVKARGCPA